MTKKVGFLKLALLGLTGAIAGAVVAIIMRPEYPSDHPLYAPGSVIGKPTLYSMFTQGLQGTDPTNRSALIYLIAGVILGVLLGSLLAYVTSKKKA
jgi:hypothetical protein